jgi:pimeloyl-ACP methyl ester carboxylesterase
MTDFLLIHGGCHGAWCWEPLIAALAELGHRGHAFDLPGAGADPTPRREVTVERCLAAVSAFTEQRGLDDFVLVGHSIAGLLLPGIALRHPGQIVEVVFLAAVVLDRGERVIDFIPESRRPTYFEMADASEDRTIHVGFEEAWRRYFDGLSEEDARACFARLTPQPFGVYLEPATVSARELAVPKRYVVCRRDVTFPPELCRRLGRKLGGDVVEIDAGHGAMLSHPKPLARLLAASPRVRGG